MDAEEFEFRPITEGLGFHRKSNPLKAEKGEKAKNEGQVLDSIKSPIQQAASLSAQLGLDASDAPTNSEPTRNFLNEKPKSKSPWGEPIVRKPLPRTGDDRKAGPVHSTMAVSSAVARAASALSGNTPTSFIPAVRNSVTSTSAGIEAMVKANLPSSVFSWSAAFVDTVMVLATSLIFLVTLLVITDVDLMNLLAQPELTAMTYISLGVLLLAVAQIYMVGSRGWAGVTLGDWAFDVEVGNYLERAKMSFPIKLLVRSLLYTMTGFVVLPLIATLTKRDITGQLTGLTLQSRN